MRTGPKLAGDRTVWFYKYADSNDMLAESKEMRSGP